MLVRDPYSGFLHEVDEGPDLSEYDMGEVVYDGLGNPVGVLPALVPLITSALPALAKTVLPAVTSAIPKLISSLGPGPVAPMAPASPPMPTPVAPVTTLPPPHPPGAPGPIMMLRRRSRRRRPYAR